MWTIVDSSDLQSLWINDLTLTVVELLIIIIPIKITAVDRATQVFHQHSDWSHDRNGDIGNRIWTGGGRGRGQDVMSWWWGE